MIVRFRFGPLLLGDRHIIGLGGISGWRVNDSWSWSIIAVGSLIFGVGVLFFGIGAFLPGIGSVIPAVGQLLLGAREDHC